MRSYPKIINSCWRSTSGSKLRLIVNLFPDEGNENDNLYTFPIRKTF